MYLKEHINYMRIRCDISDLVKDWKGLNAGQLTKELETVLSANALVSLGMAKWEIKYQLADEAKVAKILNDFKDTYQTAEQRSEEIKRLTHTL